MLRRMLMTAVSAITIAGPALAADFPSPQAPPTYLPTIPIFTWTGVYVGGQVGYAWGNDNFEVIDPMTGIASAGGSSPNGVIGGAHVGYNLQMNQWVVGLEGDVNGTSFSATTAPFPAASTSTRSDVQGSIRGRAGIAWDRALIYATGGAAFGGFTRTYSDPFGFDSFATTRAGWTVGGGLEYAITNNWSVRAEYRYSDFGRTTDAPFGGLMLVQHHLTENQVQVGFSYKFDAFAPLGPIVASY